MISRQLELRGRDDSVEPVPLTEILGSRELQKLRDHFDEAVLCDMARVLGKKLPDSKWFVDGILDQFYSKAKLPVTEEYKQFAARRESQLITLFLVFSRGQGVFLGIHLYCGLMMGMSPEELTQHVMLVGVYGGIAVLNTGLTTLERLFTLLKGLAAPNAPNPTPAVVLRELALALGPSLAR
ncbi:hypothetical protein [Hyalangium versicolor]|uniref:hypothetical protein n=1 Tax=Hyalangium versicolor TaxID=2861190 RepID=UPI001CCB327E|nr:hypothetical protein [Hyalangium versicolor]